MINSFLFVFFSPHIFSVRYIILICFCFFAFYSLHFVVSFLAGHFFFSKYDFLNLIYFHFIISANRSNRWCTSNSQLWSIIWIIHRAQRHTHTLIYKALMAWKHWKRKYGKSSPRKVIENAKMKRVLILFIKLYCCYYWMINETSEIACEWQHQCVSVW